MLFAEREREREKEKERGRDEDRRSASLRVLRVVRVDTNVFDEKIVGTFSSVIIIYGF